MFFIGAVVLLTVLSCQKEEQQYRNTEELSQKELITCSFGDNDSDTKTITPSKGGNFWQNGDEIMLYDGVSNFQKLTLASRGDASSTTGVIKQDASKFTFVKPSGWTNVYAIYPYGACVSEFSASAPKLNFADQDGTFGRANISAAVEISGSMSFKNVGAILFHVRKPTAQNATNIVVPVAELANDFQLSFTGGLPILTPVSATHSNSFDINVSNNSIYIGVPAGCTIPKGSAFLYRTSAKAIINSYVTGASNTTERNKKYTLPEITADGKLPGVFSVSATKKVRFSKGNLQFQAGDGTSANPKWQFAGNQYDALGNAAGNNTSSGRDTQSAWIDLFGWGATGQNSYGQKPYSINTKDDNYKAEACAGSGETLTIANKADWGYCMGGETSVWYTLSHDEWEYLFGAEGGRYEMYRYGVTVAGNANCVLLYPDGFSGTIVEYDDKTSYDTAEKWAVAEAQGVVCLPAAGYRYDGSNVTSVGEEGHYWTSTATNDTKAYQMEFCDYFDPSTNNWRSFGLSVRLVTAAQ